MLPALIDTDILSAIMRRQAMAAAQAQTYLATHKQFTISIITRYEILRGLKAKGAHAQVAAFDRFCATTHVLPLTDEIIVQAAEIYADLYRRGELIGDADILIAASARVNHLAIVTNNETHFGRISGLEIENWLKS
jgi:tRNA(fMet)-specific endonuclease VapC